MWRPVGLPWSVWTDLVSTLTRHYYGFFQQMISNVSTLTLRRYRSRVRQCGLSCEILIKHNTDNEALLWPSMTLIILSSQRMEDLQHSDFTLFYFFIFLVCYFLVVVGTFIFKLLCIFQTKFCAFLGMSLFAILNVTTPQKIITHLTEMAQFACVLLFIESKV